MIVITDISNYTKKKN